LAKHPKVVALGEMGLDFHRSVVHKNEQIQGLVWQLELAGELQLPVIIHNRQATNEMIETLSGWVQKSSADSPGVIHCFQENADNAQIFWKWGFICRSGDTSASPKSDAAVIKTVPQDRLLVETDCPYLRRRNTAGSGMNRLISH